MKIFQTSISKEKGYYHILLNFDDGKCRSLCDRISQVNVKNLTSPPYETYDPKKHDRKLCPKCVARAYEVRLVNVVVTEKDFEELLTLRQMLANRKEK